MNTEDLELYFNEKMTGISLSKKIDHEVHNYKTLVKKGGASAPVCLYGSKNLFVGKNEILNLFLSFQSGVLSKWHLSYICNAIEMSEQITFENEPLNEIVSKIANFENIDEISVDIFKSLLNGL